jgi:hypothetical protein
MKRITSLIAALAMALTVPLAALAAPPEMPKIPVIYHGSVRIDGNIAPVGTKITAEVAGAEVASSGVDSTGNYGFAISQSKVPVDTLLELKVNGKAVADSGKNFVVVDIEKSSIVQYDLAITTTSNPPASGGGPSGGNNGGTKPTPTDKDEDEDDDREEEPSEWIYNPEELGDGDGSVKGETSVNVIDGDIIQCANSANPFAVYIVKIVNGKRYIRHIVSLDIFNFYSHLRWENLIQVSSLDGYDLSGWVRVNTGANGTAGPNDKVWEINGDQTRHWIDMTAEEFLLHGGSEDAIYSINAGELNLYKIGAAVKLM